MKNWTVYRKGLLSIALLAGVTAGVLIFSASTTQAVPADKVTICHAAGQEGTLHYIELTLSYNGAFGQAGHFYEDGTPQAGHENDTLGPCATPSPTPTPTPNGV